MDHPVEQLLVAIVGGEHHESLGEHRCDRALAQRLDDAALQQRVDVIVLYDLACVPEQGGRVPGDGAGILGPPQPLGRAAARPDAAQLRPQDLGRQEVVLDEVAQRAPDPVLPGRDDGGVGNRNVEGMPKEGGDREPVGDPADHGRFGRRPHVAQPGVARLEVVRDDEDAGHHHEQPGRPAFHQDELALPLLGIGKLLEPDRPAPGHRCLRGHQEKN